MRRARRRSRLGGRVVALLMAALAACESPLGLGDGQGDRLEENRQRWENLGYSSYDLTLQRLCFCGFVAPVRVEVRDGEKVAVRPTTDEPAQVPADQFPTVDGLFDIVADAILRDAHELEVRYGNLGVPVRIEIDYLENVIDEEVTWVVLSLVPR